VQLPMSKILTAVSALWQGQVQPIASEPGLGFDFMVATVAPNAVQAWSINPPRGSEPLNHPSAHARSAGRCNGLWGEGGTGLFSLSNPQNGHLCQVQGRRNQALLKTKRGSVLYCLFVPATKPLVPSIWLISI